MCDLALSCRFRNSFMENNVEEVFKAASTCATPPARVAPGEYMWDKLT